jgi:hypothetical protein
MKTHVFYIEQHDWLVKAYIDTTSEDADVILDELLSIGANMDVMRMAYKNLNSGEKNTGLTYASPWNRETIIVVSRATSAKEYFNSIVHEIAHAGVYTCEALGIDLKSEQAAYFQGGLARDLFHCIKDFLCECCRHKISHGEQ